MFLSYFNTILISIFLMFACVNEKQSKRHSDSSQSKQTESTDDSPAPDIHTSENALDWAGTYAGVLPCADCAGIETRVYLSYSGTYRKASVYLGKDDRAFSEAGQIEWSKDGSKITLKPAEGEGQSFAVGEGFIQLLDKNGKVIRGELKENYILEMQPTDQEILGKKWILKSIKGMPIAVNEKGRVPFLIFDGEAARLSGNDGCNSIIGQFSLLGSNRIQIGPLGGTKMACPEKVMKKANQFNEVLSKADSYSVEDKRLLLSKGKMAVLAKFERE